jgi:hypothetical protein
MLHMTGSLMSIAPEHQVVHRIRARAVRVMVLRPPSGGHTQVPLYQAFDLKAPCALRGWPPYQADISIAIAGRWGGGT